MDMRSDAPPEAGLKWTIFLLGSNGRSVSKSHVFGGVSSNFFAIQADRKANSSNPPFENKEEDENATQFAKVSASCLGNDSQLHGRKDATPGIFMY